MIKLIEDPRLEKGSFHGYVLSEPIRKAQDPKAKILRLTDHDLVDLTLHYCIEEMCVAGDNALYLDDALYCYAFSSIMVLSDSAFNDKIDIVRDKFRSYCNNRAKYQASLSELDLAVYRLQATGRLDPKFEAILREQTPETQAQMNGCLVLAAQMRMWRAEL